jgi:uncharacterized protein (DUF2141 family)
MKQLFLIATILFGLQPVLSQSIQLTVEIQNIRNPEGQIILSYYNSPETWLDEEFTDHEIKFSKESTKDGKLTVIIENLEPGTYGIAFSDDENGDDKMNSNWLGIPREGFGFSRNFKVHMRKPKWEEGNFRLEKDTTIVINVQYKL